jgi:GTP-binding protein HflX
VVELKRTELSVRQEKAVLVGVLLNGRTNGQTDPLDELAGLATTAGARVAGKLIQKRQSPDRSTYLGRGKVDELRELIAANDADVVVFNNDLSPAQIRNLELATDTKVLDRTELILDIFATRAQTHEARLQVELAQLQYALPRLKRMWTHLSRMEGGIGTRGPGEQQLEEDRRLVEDRITDLRRRIKQVAKRKEQQVSARGDQWTVSLVGYTNAGKSTLMNAMTGADVLVEDKLFATLDTRTRRWPVPGLGTVLLSDTVGFIRDLPHHLVASFKATLEEARRANLLLHVVDASNPAAPEQIQAVSDVLEQLECGEHATLLVLNKVDAIEDRSILDVLRSQYPEAVSVSARTGAGLAGLRTRVADLLSRSFLDAEVECDAGNGRVLAQLAAHGEVISRHFTDGRAVVRCRIPPAWFSTLEREGGVVVRLAGPPSLDEHVASSD